MCTLQLGFDGPDADILILQPQSPSQRRDGAENPHVRFRVPGGAIGPDIGRFFTLCDEVEDNDVPSANPHGAGETISELEIITSRPFPFLSFPSYRHNFSLRDFVVLRDFSALSFWAKIRMASPVFCLWLCYYKALWWGVWG